MSTTYYINGTNFSTATSVFTDADLTTCAPDGFYRLGGITREQVGCQLLAEQDCNACGVVSCGNEARYGVVQPSSGTNRYFITEIISGNTKKNGSAGKTHINITTENINFKKSYIVPPFLETSPLNSPIKLRIFEGTIENTSIQSCTSSIPGMLGTPLFWAYFKILFINIYYIIYIMMNHIETTHILSLVLLIIAIFIKYIPNKTALYICVKNNILSEFLFMNIILFSYIENEINGILFLIIYFSIITLDKTKIKEEFVNNYITY